MNKDEFYNKKEEEEYLYVSDDEDEFTEQQDNNLLFKHLLDLNEIAGFLLLDRTYGRKGKKLLYKVQPYNRSYPCLLIPFENKIEFSKELLNKYILFKYDNFNNKPITGFLVRNFEMLIAYNHIIYMKCLEKILKIIIMFLIKN